MIIAYAAIILGTVRYVVCQCDGTAQQISSGSGLIQSPNYPNEYRKSADCRWNFTRPSEGSEFLLELTITTMRLYFEDVNDRRYCPGHYELAIDGETLDCTISVTNDLNSSFCHAYNTTSCTRLESPCGTVKSFPSSFQVTYISNGQTSGDQTIWGFRIEYKYIDCREPPDIPSTTATAPTTTSDGPTPPPTTTTTGTTPGVESTLTTDEVNNGANETSTSSTSATSESPVSSTQSFTPEVPPSRSSSEATDITRTTTPGTVNNNVLPIVLGVLGGVLLILLVGIIIWYIRRRRQNTASNGQSVGFTSSGDTPEGEYENEALPRTNKKALMPQNVHAHTYVNEPAKVPYVNDPTRVSVELADDPKGPYDGYEATEYEGDIQL